MEHSGNGGPKPDVWPDVMGEFAEALAPFIGASKPENLIKSEDGENRAQSDDDDYWDNVPV